VIPCAGHSTVHVHVQAAIATEETCAFYSHMYRLGRIFYVIVAVCMYQWINQFYGFTRNMNRMPLKRAVHAGLN